MGAKERKKEVFSVDIFLEFLRDLKAFNTINVTCVNPCKLTLKRKILTPVSSFSQIRNITATCALIYEMCVCVCASQEPVRILMPMFMILDLSLFQFLTLIHRLIEVIWNIKFFVSLRSWCYKNLL